MTSDPSLPAEPVDILLVGLGSIGTVYAYILENSGKARVTAVARSNYDLYTKSGVQLKTGKFGDIDGWRPHRVVKSQAEALADGQKYDYALVTTKCLPDVLPTTTLLADAIASGQIGAYALIQNGIEVEADLYAAVKSTSTPIISCMAYIGIMTTPDGSTVNWPGRDILVAGVYPPKSEGREFTDRETKALDVWHALLKVGGANIKVTDRVDQERFNKNVFNCAWSSIQGLVRATPYVFTPLSPELHDYIKSFIREIVTVGYESGLLYEGMIHPSGVVMGGIEAGVKMGFDQFVINAPPGGKGHKMSLLLDVERGRPIEVEVIVGGVLAIAKKFNIPTPLLGFTYTLLKGLQNSIVDQAAQAKAASSA